MSLRRIFRFRYQKGFTANSWRSTAWVELTQPFSARVDRQLSPSSFNFRRGAGTLIIRQRGDAAARTPMVHAYTMQAT